jgi:Cu/Ag efflux pump CusA
MRLMLFGIVGKNSILMVDFIIEARARGVSRREAILSAGRERARPIVMTTLAMVGGMLPAAIGSGSDDGFRAPMAIAIIGGLITSTALSLLLVPVVYSALDDFESWLKRQLIRGQRTRAPAAGKLPDTPISNGQVFENGRVLRREIASLRSQ